MPFYDYKCQQCGNAFNEVKSIYDDIENCTCPVCGHTAQIVVSGIGSYDIKGDNSASTPPKTTVRARKTDD